MTEVTNKPQWKPWGESHQHPPPCSLCAGGFTAERKPPPCFPLGFPPQQTDGIIETTCTGTPRPKSQHTGGTSKSISAMLVSDWTFNSSLSATYSKDRKAVKSKSKSTLQSDNQGLFSSFLLFRKILCFQTLSSFSVSQPPDYPAYPSNLSGQVAVAQPPHTLLMWVRETDTCPNLPTKLIFMWTSRQLSSLTLTDEKLAKAILERCLKMFSSSKSIDQLS